MSSFAKIFASIYDGTLADNWQALVTFQQMLILCDLNGVVDMTPQAISRKTGIPLEIIQAGIEVLEGPDEQSRSEAMSGRRIARLDSGRSWGWFLVNHAEYRRRISIDEKRESDRSRIAARRASTRVVADCSDVSQGVADCSDVSEEVANVAHTDTDTDTELKARARATAPQRDETAAASPGRGGRRGTRLPDGWQPSEAVREWAAAEFPAVSFEAALAEFTDYWRAVPGQRGVKLDWDATFRNRVREIAARRRPGESHGPHRESAAGKAARLCREGDERERRAAAGLA